MALNQTKKLNAAVNLRFEQKTLIKTIILEGHKMIYMHNRTKYLDI